MTNRSLAQPAPPAKATRELRGLALFRDYHEEITPEGHGVYTVPGCSGGSYCVDLAVFSDEPETCSCPDYRRHKQPCLHVYATSLYRAKARAKARRVQAKKTAARTRSASASLAHLAVIL